MSKGQFNDTNYALKAFFAASVIVQVTFGWDEFVEDPAILVEAVVGVDVAVADVADMSIDAAFAVVVVDAVVAYVDAGWIDDVVVFVAARATDKSNVNGGIIEAVVPAKDEGMVVCETIDQMILLGGWMRATREMSKRYQRSFANGENGGNITNGTSLGKIDPKGIFQELDMFMKDL